MQLDAAFRHAVYASDEVCMPRSRPMFLGSSAMSLGSCFHIDHFACAAFTPCPTGLQNVGGLMAHSLTDSAAQTLVHSSVYGALPWHAFMNSAIYVDA